MVSRIQKPEVLVKIRFSKYISNCRPIFSVIVTTRKPISKYFKWRLFFAAVNATGPARTTVAASGDSAALLPTTATAPAA